MKTQAYSLVLGGLLAACVGSEASDLDRYFSALDQSIHSMQSTTATHGHDVLATTDITRMHGLEQTYKADLTGHVSHVRGAQNDMMSCASCATSVAEAEQALCDDTGSVGPMMDGVNSELMRHWQAMEAITDVDAAHREEERHGSVMNATITNLHGADGDIMHAMQTMMDHGMSMMCSMAGRRLSDVTT